ncbi:CDP-glycerol glycerophosphotransferase family protein [Halobacillus naozhouensis]|uniref:CDP-glycerol glycerophosphotransferase family protein n=1 Tax=Halobacillus naozhouensis TaxID=554880 RepID=A0ABY8IVJ2_9BACI|nr:CDP-glycerol glycerophosphotransferase family protein [Halobacillus naozhouensis]WFT73807.1 CDP-glycerol glycerophosphotransferase family protein [Halobacillus naozhouensis]
MITAQVEKIDSKNEAMIITARISSSRALSSYGKIILKGRRNLTEFTSDNICLEVAKEKTNKNLVYLVKGSLDYSSLNNGELLPEDIYDLYLIVDNGSYTELRLGNPTFNGRYLKKDGSYSKHSEVMLLNAYYTFKKSNLSIEVVRYPASIYRYYKWVIRLSFLIRIWLYPKNIWIVGEQPYKAQDTGVSFFKYVRDKYPSKNIFYIMDIESAEYEKVKELGNIISYKSRKHILYVIGARRIISSHHPEYLYPNKTEKFKRKVKGTKIFLQHGVMGTKNMSSNYGKKAYNFNIDEFLVSSDLEKGIVVNDLGYDSRQVHITGLSRFDTLLNKKKNNIKRQILIIPTWRDWITTSVNFTDSEYFQEYKNLLESKELHELAIKYEFDIVFCLHPNMQLYSHHFIAQPSVRVISLGEVNVQDLIKESALMVTDYSSVGFDFSFLNKPVIYYQFDQGRFLGKKGSHLNLDRDLPGKICFTNQGVLELIEKYAKMDFGVEDEFVQRSRKFIKYKDTSSNRRIYNVVKNAKKSSYFSNNSLVFIIINKSLQKLRRKIRR